MMHVPRLGLGLVISTVISGCELITVLPVIQEQPVGFTSSSDDMRLVATIQQRGQPISDALRVRCVVSLELTPTVRSPDVTVAGQRMAGSVWNCPFPDSLRNQVRANQSIVFRWRVLSRDSQGDDLVVAETADRRFLLDCPGGQAAAMIAENIAVTNRYAGLSTAAEIAAAGFLPSHNFASTRGLGVAFVRASDAPSAVSLASAGPPILGAPNLLIFMPQPGRNVTDVLPDDPYTLTGWAYAQPLRGDRALPRPPSGARDAGDSRPEQPRPTLNCVPHHEWMLHAEGIHLVDGGFHTGLTQTLPGGFIVPVLGLPHTALWDLHVWRAPTGSQAVISLFAPVDTPGVSAPADAFFYPTVYD